MGSNTIQITDDTFEKEVLQSNIPVLIDFWAEWCGPCRALGPTLEEVAGEYKGKVKIVKMNVDENPETPSQFGVRSIPTVILFKDGKQVQAAVGNMPKAQVVTLIQQAL